MRDLVELKPGHLLVLLSPKAEKKILLEMAAALALRGQVRVLDGGNGFSAYQVARLLRRHTSKLTEAMENIYLARAFTCYQVVALFEETPSSTDPHLVLDLLATFYDESIPPVESFRLLSLVVDHLKRLKKHTLVAVSLYPPKIQQPDRTGLTEMVTDAADSVFIQDTPQTLHPAQLL